MIAMPRYLYTVYTHEQYDSTYPDDSRSAHAAQALRAQMQAAGVWVCGGGLVRASSATVLRVTAVGDVSMTDGPFTETSQQLNCVWVVEAPDFDVALDWARRSAVAYERPIEVRPFHGLT